MTGLRVRVLGGLAVEGVEPAALGSRKQRRLLGRLVVAQGAVVSADELADDLWGDAQPASPRDDLAVLVSRLRSALPRGALTRRDAGYALAVDWSDLAALAERRQEAARAAAAALAGVGRVAATIRASDSARIRYPSAHAISFVHRDTCLRPPAPPTSRWAESSTAAGRRSRSRA